MPVKIIRNDITKMDVDAIVNAANRTLLGGGGVDGAIHRAAGPGLLQECRGLGGCETGQAKITKGYNLPAKYVIHTVGPVWQGGNHNEKALLLSSYKSSLKLADQYNLESVAFPLISSGIYGYPKEQALEVAIQAIEKFLENHEMMVYLVIFDQESFQISQKRFDDIASYIEDHYVQSQPDIRRSRRLNSERRRSASWLPSERFVAVQKSRQKVTEKPFYMSEPSWAKPLDKALDNLDESFSQMLLRKIDEAGLSDSQAYKKANVDRRLFSKIRSDPHYKPSKQTVLAFAIALQLSLEETEEFLKKAGFALSHANKQDVIIEFFIQNEIYSIMEINQALFAFEQPLLGA